MPCESHANNKYVGRHFTHPSWLERDQGLLLLLLRDILEGELLLGWGKGRGYGRFHVGLQIGAEQEITDWAGLKASLHTRIPSLQDRLKALHESLE